MEKLDQNLTLLTDYYQINMMYAHFQQGTTDKQVVFDLFYRTNPCGNGFAIAAGLQQVIDYISNLRFSEEDIEYLRTLEKYSDAFLDSLRSFRFTGELWAIPEGTIVFPQEPLLRVKARVFEAHLVETALLTIINHQTLLATKAARVVQAAGDDPVLEFGLRRAQGPDAGVYGARACYIGGVTSTSNVLAGKMFGIPVAGTHAHAYVQSFPSEIDAFRAFVKTFPDNAILLVDTYDTLKSGVPNAIQVFHELHSQLGREPKNFGIRLDSGDLAYLSKEARKMLDAAGFTKAKIVASGDLDEYLIRDLKLQGAKINVWGVGTNLITSKDCPALGGVYKLSAEEEDGQMVPKIKISENPTKINNPGVKKIVRFYSKKNDRALADVIMLENEALPTDDYEIFHPIFTIKRKVLTSYYTEELLVPIFKDGKLVYQSPDIEDIRLRVKNQMKRFSPEILRLTNPHEYHVDLSKTLWQLKNKLMNEAKERTRYESS